MERELLLLGVLRGQAVHGYGALDVIDRFLAMCTDLKRPTAYFLLKKMTRAGWVKARAMRSGRRPERRVYSLTPAGETAYQRLLRDNLARYSPVTMPGDIGLAFSNDLPPDEARALLQVRRTALKQALAEAKAAPEHPGAWQWLLDHRRQYLASELAFLSTVLRKLGQPRPSQPEHKRAYDERKHATR